MCAHQVQRSQKPTEGRRVSLSLNHRFSPKHLCKITLSVQVNVANILLPRYFWEHTLKAVQLKDYPGSVASNWDNFSV